MESTDSDKSYETNSGSKEASLHLYLEIRQMIRILRMKRRYLLVLEKLGMLLCEKGRGCSFVGWYWFGYLLFGERPNRRSCSSRQSRLGRLVGTVVRFTRQAWYGSVRLDSQLHLFLIHCDPLLLKKRKIDSHIKKLFCSASPTLAHVSNQANQTACEDTFLYALFFFPTRTKGLHLWKP